MKKNSEKNWRVCLETFLLLCFCPASTPITFLDLLKSYKPSVGVTYCKAWRMLWFEEQYLVTWLLYIWNKLLLLMLAFQFWNPKNKPRFLCLTVNCGLFAFLCFLNPRIYQWNEGLYFSERSELQRKSEF